MDNTEAPKVRLYTVREFAGLFGVSYWTIRNMVLEGTIYENEIVRIRKSTRIKHDAYERLVNGSKTSRASKPRKGLTHEEECARHRHERAYESLQRRLGIK